MDYLKRQFSNTKENFEITIQPISITLVPPPTVAVNVFIRMQRE